MTAKTKPAKTKPDRLTCHLSLERGIDFLFDGLTPEELLEQVEALQNKYSPYLIQYGSGSKLIFSRSPVGYVGGIELNLILRHLETDQDYSVRCARLEKEAENLKKKELAQLAKLKAKYKGDTE